MAVDEPPPAGEPLPPFVALTDLAAERVGGKALLASDEFFAPKENLLKAGRGVFIPGKYTGRGKWMDGWESRRKRVPGHDWCVLRLGIPGEIRGLDIDTNHFLGNHPPRASVEACECAGVGAVDPPLRGPRAASVAWTEILPQSPLQPGSRNLFPVADGRRWTHLRLNIFPDGGVARLRVHGEALPDWDQVKPGRVLDLASVRLGGLVLAANDMFFGPKDNLIMPGRGKDMGDGWETRRRRGPGHDWVLVRLAAPGLLRAVEVDTAHFKGNYPDRCSLDGVLAPGAPAVDLAADDSAWTEVLPELKLGPDRRHLFAKQIRAPGPWSHVRLHIYPDGGVSRLRLFGTRSP